jgi:hypothetical protein
MSPLRSYFSIVAGHGSTVAHSCGTFARYCCAALVFALLIYGCSSSKTSGDASQSQTAAWQQHPLVIDGYDDDWTLALPYYDRKEKLNFAVSNDKDNVYIRLAIQDPQEQQKILQGGMTVWVNGQAEKNISTAVGIGFPLDARSDRNRQLMAEAQPQHYKYNPRTLDDLTEFSLYGFKKDSIPTYEIGQSNTEGVWVKMNFNRAHTLIYEASIPLNFVYPQNTSNNFAGKSLAVGFALEGLPPNAPAPRGSGGGGGGVSIGGDMGMGSFGGGGGMGIGIGTGSLGQIGGGRSKRQLYDQSETWQVVSLARPGK